MYCDVKEARYVKDYKIELSFEDGKKGVADFKGYAKKGGLFSRLSEVEYFKRFFVNKELGVLCWPDGQDIAPETLYHKATDSPLPAWMTSEATDKKTG